ncbi:MAG TPA: acyl-CoA dehydrogenase family protein [Polyangiaceae bacterium]
MAGAVLQTFPIAELEIEDTWRVAGMRGTGSNTTIARDVFVPHARALGGEFVSGVHDAERPEMEPCERWPLPSVLALVLSGPPLGMAQCAFDAVLGNVGQRGVSYTSYARQADSAALLQNLGEAALELETAKLHVFRAAAELDAVAAGRDMSSLALARVRGACGLASRALRSAMDGLVSVGGASSFAEGSVVQRQWRDLNMATRHAFVATGVSFEAYGRELAGREAIYNFV